ncbi:MAG: MASE1 domain-containing protein [Minisyncoccia bacterium]
MKTLTTPRSRILYGLELAVVGLLYYLAARIGLDFAAVNEFAAFIWPATGIAIAAIYLRGYRLWPAIFIAAFVANYFNGAPLFAALAVAAGNTLEAVMALWLLRMFRFNHLFGRLVDSFSFILVALSASVISATIGVSALAATPLLGVQEIPITWLAWWTGDVLGALVVGSLLIRWLCSPMNLSSRSVRDFFESVLFFSALIIVALLVFWEPVPILAEVIPPYMLFVPLTWGALRMGPRMMTFAIATLAALAIIGTATDTGPFVVSIMFPEQAFFLLQLFLATVSFIFLLFVAVVEERKENAKQLRDNVASLERDVYEISEADQAKNDFIATLSHELRNPLSPVLSSLELMRARKPAEPESHMIGVIYDNVIRMARLLDDLLDVARISKKKFTLQMRTVGVNQILTHSAEMTRPMMEKSKHSFSITLLKKDVQLNADELRIEQVVVNLLTNAAKYTPPGGKITLLAGLAKRDHQSGVEIRIIDNGIGIPRSELDRIFEPFRQLDAAQGAYNAGLGIGLSLAKRLIELHGGAIQAHSEGQGTGSEFAVWLPIANPVILLPAAEQKALKKLSAADAAPTQSKQKRTVLVVDDNEDAANALARLLNHAGHTARAAYDGAQALATLANFRPEVIFLDIGLPNESGYNVAQQIRSYMDPQPTIVALTGYGQEEDKRKALDAGFDAHLTKPVAVADLEKILSE